MHFVAAVAAEKCWGVGGLQAGVVVFARGALAAYGPDYFLVGYTAGKQAARILKGEDPGTIPAGLALAYSLWVSLKNAQMQGVKLPITLVEKAADKLWDEQGNVVKGK